MRYIGIMALIVSVAGCDALYRTSAVVPGVAEGTNVRVMPVTAETVIQANKAAYSPATLPAIYSQTSGGPGNLRGAGALPEPPLQIAVVSR